MSIATKVLTVVGDYIEHDVDADTTLISLNCDNDDLEELSTLLSEIFGINYDIDLDSAHTLADIITKISEITDN